MPKVSTRSRRATGRDLATSAALMTALDLVADPVVVFDEGLRVVYGNAALSRRAGRPVSALVGRPLADVLAADTASWVGSLDADRANPGPHAREMDDQQLQGHFVFEVVPMMKGRSRGGVVLARQLRPAGDGASERTRRERIGQAEKLAALGQLVAGIAHELNNPLQGVLGHLELLRVTRGYPKELRHDLQTIYREADRAAKIVRNLLVFAGARSTVRRRSSLNALISRAVAFRLDSCRAAGIEIVRQFDEAMPRIEGDPFLLQQAFLNILLNAEQAVAAKGGGRIEIRTSWHRRPRMLVAEIRDTGAGLGPDILPRIFEPFYTTKEVGKGTGLGLAITYGIIQEHGGAIHATNHPDGGAVFTVELPPHAATVVK